LDFHTAFSENPAPQTIHQVINKQFFIHNKQLPSARMASLFSQNGYILQASAGTFLQSPSSNFRLVDRALRVHDRPAGSVDSCLKVSF
jgi:hypothetical protein